MDGMNRKFSHEFLALYGLKFKVKNAINYCLFKEEDGLSDGYWRRSSIFFRFSKITNQKLSKISPILGKECVIVKEILTPSV